MSELAWGSGPTQYFFELTPDRVMDALEASPLRGVKRECTGFCQPLASFENRVYEVEFEDAEGQKERAVAKFYRPGRWTAEQIQEEHEFILQIEDAEIPVVAPMWFEQTKDTLRQTERGLFYCAYPKVGGRQPEDLRPEQLMQLGRLIARMHQVGSLKKAAHRFVLNPANYGQASLDYLLGERIISQSYESRFADLVSEIIDDAEVKFKGQLLQRIHGDCHAGNILWSEKLGPTFLDFDDMVMGPPVQDLWLLAPDSQSFAFLQEGYEQMRALPLGSEQLVKPLRLLRMIHYATWIAKRYDDPAFQKAFPQFESPRYWQELTTDLEKVFYDYTV